MLFSQIIPPSPSPTESKSRSEWLRSKSLQAINAGEGVVKREPSYLLVGKKTSTATKENSVEIP